MKQFKFYRQYLNELNDPRESDGLWVHTDNNKDRYKIEAFIDKTKYHGEWDESAGAFWFPESAESYDELEKVLTKEFNKLRIKSYWFEAST